MRMLSAKYNKKFGGIMNLRDSRFELLRIMSIIGIVLAHFSLWTPWHLENITAFNVNMVYFFRPFGQIGVYLFILITAWFMSNDIPTFNKGITRTKKILSQVIFYSIFIQIIYSLLMDNWAVKPLIKSFFPILFNQYWFVTAYVILIILLPYINRIMNVISRTEHQYLSLSMILFSFIFPLIGNHITGTMYSFSTICTVYIIGAYIKKYDFTLKNKSIYTIILVIMSLLYVAQILAYLLLHRLSGIDKLNYGLMPTIIAVGIFLLVKNQEKYYSTKINWLSKNVFAVYLITVHPSINSVFFTHGLNVSESVYDVRIIIIGVVYSTFLVLTSIIIDKTREKAFNFISFLFNKFSF